MDDSVKPVTRKKRSNTDDEEKVDNDQGNLTESILQQAELQLQEEEREELRRNQLMEGVDEEDGEEKGLESDDEEGSEDGEFDDFGEFENFEDVEIGEDILGELGLDVEEEEVIGSLLFSSTSNRLNLADLIMQKMENLEQEEKRNAEREGEEGERKEQEKKGIPDRVLEVYRSLGTILHRYKSGKLPKALQMLPHLSHFHPLLLLTRPDSWFG